MRQITLIFIALLVLGAGISSGPVIPALAAVPPPEIIQRLRAAVFATYDDYTLYTVVEQGGKTKTYSGRSCTAFFVRPSSSTGSFVASAGHCSDVTLAIPNNPAYATPKYLGWYWYGLLPAVISNVAVTDSALFVMTDARPDRVYLDKVIDRDLELGEEVVILGYDKGTLTWHFCSYNGRDPSRWGWNMLDCKNDPIQDGLSGAPILTYDGELVGIMTSTLARDNTVGFYSDMRRVWKMWETSLFFLIDGSDAP